MKFIEKNEEGLNESVKILKEGGIIAFPTETVFGLGIISSKEEYFLRLVEIKKRRPDKPFTLMISSIEQIKDIVEINDLAKKIIDNFLPGELTIILKAKENVPSYLSLGTNYIGIRIPNDPFILKLIDKVNLPLLVPSCNPSDLKPATNDLEAYAYFKDKIEGIIKGNSVSNTPSTVIKIENDNIILLREGNIKINDIKEKIL